VHDAAEKNVTVGPDERRYHGTRDRNAVRDGEVKLERRILPPAPGSQSRLTDRTSNENAADCDKRRAQIGVKPAMQRILAPKHIICGLKIGDDLRETEHRETKMPRRDSFDRRCRPKVIGSEASFRDKRPNGQRST
jgi:hypothetical protein